MFTMYTSSKYVCWESTTVIDGNVSCLQCLQAVGIYYCHRWQYVMFTSSKYVWWETTTVFDGNVSCLQCLQAVNMYVGNPPLSYMAMGNVYSVYKQ